MPRAPFLTPNRILNKIKRLRAQGQAPNSYQIVWPLQQHDAERAEARLCRTGSHGDPWRNHDQPR